MLVKELLATNEQRAIKQFITQSTRHFQEVSQRLRNFQAQVDNLREEFKSTTSKKQLSGNFLSKIRSKLESWISKSEEREETKEELLQSFLDSVRQVFERDRRILLNDLKMIQTYRDRLGTLIQKADQLIVTLSAQLETSEFSSPYQASYLKKRISALQSFKNDLKRAITTFNNLEISALNLIEEIEHSSSLLVTNLMTNLAVHSMIQSQRSIAQSLTEIKRLNSELAVETAEMLKDLLDDVEEAIAQPLYDSETQQRISDLTEEALQKLEQLFETMANKAEESYQKARELEQTFDEFVKRSETLRKEITSALRGGQM